MLVYYPTWRAIHFNHPFAHSFRSKRRRIKVLVSFRKPSDRLGRGFTLIELLIVIAIILILIAIALPNFLEAQERARVARAAGHLRTMETAVFSFITQYGYLYADYNDPAGVKRETRNHQPLATGPCPIFSPGVLGDGGLSFGSDPNGNDTNFQGTFYAPSVHCPLTTPIQFIDGTSTVDPWSDGSVPVGMDSRYCGGSEPGTSCEGVVDKIVYSAYFVSGPDRHSGEWLRGCDNYLGRGVGCAYSPTNGTKSRGDLWFVVSEYTGKAKIEYPIQKSF
ncbi:MAG: prepilin-type N-terminal cleavage/methylation domain-containing protein [Candidatus Omnitrophica bacterium]|nr:prepilin-type N-terminal cleavage/methylation domain-containing protein [Candidatus Omnitrophota bacterium]MCB9781472.1 prepilin-type N-terminal cleavage/methylation domain-containing protein [Candidatus Omnitrophota bacterium]